MKKNKIYMGIDPGGQGFITWFQGEDIHFKALADFKQGKEWSILEISKFFFQFINNDIHIVLEHVNCDPQWTALTNWSLSRCKAILESMFAAYELPHTLVAPKAWQKEMFQGVPEMRKPGKNNKKGVFVRGRLDTKPMSILASQRLFPNVNLAHGKTARATKPHDGKSDSLLMCEYCRRNF